MPACRIGCRVHGHFGAPEATSWSDDLGRAQGTARTFAIVATARSYDASATGFRVRLSVR